MTRPATVPPSISFVLVLGCGGNGSGTTPSTETDVSTGTDASATDEGGSGSTTGSSTTSGTSSSGTGTGSSEGSGSSGSGSESTSSSSGETGESGGSETGPGSTESGGETPTHALVYVSGGSSDIAIFELDLESGALSPHGGSTEGGNRPTYMAFSPAADRAYAVNEGDPSVVRSFSVDPADGGLTHVGDDADTAPGFGAPHLAVDPTSAWVLVAHYGSGHVTVHGLGSDGAALDTASWQRPADSTTHQIVFDGSGEHVFVPCIETNSVAQYLFDAEDGTLAPNDPAEAVAPWEGTGPRHMAFHPTRPMAYVLGELNGGLVSYAYDDATGTLVDGEEVSAVPEGGPEGSAAHVVVHPGGDFVYASLRDRQRVSILAVDSATGRLELVGDEDGGGDIDNPRDFAIDPTGNWLILANQNADNVMIFAIDSSSGSLSLTDTVSTGSTDQPQFVGMVPRP